MAWVVLVLVLLVIGVLAARRGVDHSGSSGETSGATPRTMTETLDQEPKQE